jgi:hypothetical protein
MTVIYTTLGTVLIKRLSASSGVPQILGFLDFARIFHHRVLSSVSLSPISSPLTCAFEIIRCDIATMHSESHRYFESHRCFPIRRLIQTTLGDAERLELFNSGRTCSIWSTRNPMACQSNDLIFPFLQTPPRIVHRNISRLARIVPYVLLVSSHANSSSRFTAHPTTFQPFGLH